MTPNKSSETCKNEKYLTAATIMGRVRPEIFVIIQLKQLLSGLSDKNQ
jgi:hypothetical protein